ncbi:MAG: SURF1 family cytochrome oxidase biogenesis protein [Ilumatobacteraceae bacterium]
MPTDPADSKGRPRSKYGFLFRPKWIAFHLLVLVLVVVMINLAFWQLRRLDQRRHFNAAVRANTAQPIVALDAVRADLSTPSKIEWRRVQVSGTYVPGHEFLVVNRSQNGDTGRNVVDALKTGDGSLLLINRGFVPTATSVPPLPTGTVSFDGRLRVSEHRTTGQPEDQSVNGLSEIHRVDIGVLAKQFDATVLPMYVEQVDPPKPFEEIVGPDTSDEGPHLSYTIQWFIFSGCVMVGWVLAVRRSLAARSGKPAKRRKSAYIPMADEESPK